MCVMWLEEGGREGGKGGVGGGHLNGVDHPLPPSPTTGQRNHRQMRLQRWLLVVNVDHAGV